MCTQAEPGQSDDGRSDPRPVEFDTAVSALPGEVGVAHPFKPREASGGADVTLRFVNTILSNLDAGDMGPGFAYGIG